MKIGFIYSDDFAKFDYGTEHGQKDMMKATGRGVVSRINGNNFPLVKS